MGISSVCYANYKQPFAQNPLDNRSYAKDNEQKTDANIFSASSKSSNKTDSASGNQKCIKNGLDFTNIVDNPARKVLLARYYHSNPIGKIGDKINWHDHQEYVQPTVDLSKEYYSKVVSALNSASTDQEAEKLAEAILSQYSQKADRLETLINKEDDGKNKKFEAVS